MIKNALKFFLNFHKGKVNIFMHVIGFLGLFYSIYKLNWLLFAIFFIVIESGHAYNHFVKIEPYDLRPKVIFWRVFIFIAFVVGFYLLTLVFK